ncbi:Alpha/Beta hydrolase protein [Mycena galopus ATCC 62051]|nr:Alpha/Beta hydrolase protein [Mycena galopus ATCC 62051]
MEEVLDVSYIPGTNDPLRSFDLYVPAHAHGGPMIVFVHGGAWHSGDKSDFKDIARGLASASSHPVLVPNYRLTTKDNRFRHPGHAEDILHFLNFLTSGSWHGLPQVKFNPVGRAMYLLGHSAGAHILSSIFLDSSAITPSLTPPPAVLKTTKGVVMSEGIYDLDLLLARFPTYREWFIAGAFGERESYSDASTTQLPLHTAVTAETNLRWLIIHSTGDTLVDQAQSDAIYGHLRALYGDGAAADAHVTRNVDRFDVEHDDVLGSPLYIDVLRAFVAQDTE